LISILYQSQGMYEVSLFI